MKHLMTILKKVLCLICFSFAAILYTSGTYAADSASTNQEVDWNQLDDASKTAIARNQARYNATGGNTEAEAIYDAQQSRITQQNSNQEAYTNTVSNIQEQLQSSIDENNKRVSRAQEFTESAKKVYESAQEKLKNATTAEEMKAANEELKRAKSLLEQAEDNQKTVEKEVNKENKNLEKAAEKSTKTAGKEYEEQQTLEGYAAGRRIGGRVYRGEERLPRHE